MSDFYLAANPEKLMGCCQSAIPRCRMLFKHMKGTISSVTAINLDEKPFRWGVNSPPYGFMVQFKIKRRV